MELGGTESYSSSHSFSLTSSSSQQAGLSPAEQGDPRAVVPNRVTISGETVEDPLDRDIEMAELSRARSRIKTGKQGGPDG
eukprot:11253952-Alexandrium_andersonii.AAC.1